MAFTHHARRLVCCWLAATALCLTSGCDEGEGPPLYTDGASLPADVGAPLTLPDPSLDGGASVRHTLATRRSIREFGTEPVTQQELSQVLWSAQGITASNSRRTAPSAGALYPFEIYVVAARVEDLDPGLYHYRIDDHTLATVRTGDVAAELIGLAQDFVAAAPVTLVLIGVVPRTAVKYGDRSTQYVLIEGGAIVQSVALQAVDLGLGTTVVGGYDDAGIQAVVNTDALPVALVVLGRP